MGTSETVKVHNFGHVRLDAAMADDLSVVNAARVSYHKRHEAMDDSDVGLIGYLMRNRHGTPFEHNAMRFVVAAPIFVFREWHRHRIASYNEWSARYSQLENRFYIPDVQHVRTQVGKAGAYTYEPAMVEMALAFQDDLDQHCQAGYRKYEEWLQRGIAKEQARLFLSFPIFSEMYWTLNARALMNFLSLRNASQAMYEIRAYAAAIESIWAVLMPVTHAAFAANGRVAP